MNAVIPAPARAPLLSFLLAAAFLALLHLTFAEHRDFAPLVAEQQSAPELFEDESEHDSEQLPVAMLPEEPAGPPAPSPEDALPQATQEPQWLQYKIRRGDQIHKILPRIGASEDAVKYFLSQRFKSYRKLRRGAIIDYKQNAGGELVELRYKTGPEYYFTAQLNENNEWSAIEAPPVLTTVTVSQGGRIDSSLFAAADSAGVPDRAIDALINALGWHIDFYRDQRQGDTFRIIYEKITDEDGVLLGVPRLLAYQYESHLRQKKRDITGLWFEGESGYYSPEGESMQGAFLRAPLKYRRVSSRFGNRKHPILKRWRAHRGVDYAARTGTPVRTTADGVVTKVERQRGYGNVVMIKHYKIYTTVYAHLHGFAKGLRRGRKVKQGDIIGYVGSTGLSTGPHLHYEFRIRGVAKDPLSSALPRRLPPLDKPSLANFQTQTRGALDSLLAIKV